MIPHRYYSSCFVLFLLVLSTFSVSHSQSQSHWSTKKKRMREKVCKMFHHGYDNAFLVTLLLWETIPNSRRLTFDVDARINLFECNIRVLGGLVSAHLLASDSSKKLIQGSYKNQLLGIRFLPAFNTPYAWINLKYGVMENETTETSTSGCFIETDR
ncbi:Glycosyl hydrolase family 47 protein [Trifolium repens]|nr:Glycosyl hydrolase family 47 protein [Trifolium repens]